MDSNGFGQTPPPPPPASPPSWPPGSYQPGQYGQYGQLDQFGQPAGRAAPPQKRSRLPLLLGIGVAVLIAAVVLYVVIGLVATNPDAGKVVFSTDKPVVGMSCRVQNQVTTVKAGTSVYAYYIYKEKQGSDQVTLQIYKDGTSLGSADVPVAQTEGMSCYGDITELSKFPAGTYKFTLTAKGETIAEGSIVITP